MLNSLLTNTDVVVSLIEGFTSILTTVIPAIILYFGGQEFLKLKNATSTALTSLKELQYMRELYTVACSRLAPFENKSPKAINKQIRSELSELGVKSEGKLPPTEINRRITVYSKPTKNTHLPTI